MQDAVSIPRFAIGPVLSKHIRGRSDIDHLRRLVKSEGTEEDLVAAEQWRREETFKLVYSPWEYDGVKEACLAVLSDMARLRGVLHAKLWDALWATPKP